jgi:hypothetical protein
MGHLLTKIRQWFTTPAPPSLVQRVADLEVETKKLQRELDDLHESYRRLSGRKNAAMRYEPDPDPAIAGATPAPAPAGNGMSKVQLWQRAREKLKR